MRTALEIGLVVQLHEQISLVLRSKNCMVCHRAKAGCTELIRDQAGMGIRKRPFRFMALVAACPHREYVLQEIQLVN